MDPLHLAFVQEGINRHVFGEGLNPLEQEWLAAVINEHLGGLPWPSLLDPPCWRLAACAWLLSISQRYQVRSRCWLSSELLAA